MLTAVRPVPFVQQAQLSVGVPAVVSVVVLDVDNVAVTFDQAVTWDGVGAGTLQIGGAPMTWLAQLSASSIQANDGGGALMSPGQAWSWSASDSSLAPTPNPAQSGVTV